MYVCVHACVCACVCVCVSARQSAWDSKPPLPAKPFHQVEISVKVKLWRK